MGDADQKGLLTIEAFSKESGLSEMMVRRMVRNRQLAAFQPMGPKGKWFIPRKALDDFDQKAFTRVQKKEGGESGNANLPIPGRKPKWR